MKKSKKKIMRREPKAERRAPMVFDPEIIDIIRKSIAPQLTDAELKVYLGVCRKYNADPIMKDIVPVIFTTKKHGRVLNFIMTRDFLLKIANKEDKLDGLQSKVIRNDKGFIIGASAIAWKKGCSHPFEADVDFKEYYNKNNEVWGTHPGAMICKVAEVKVLKLGWNVDMLVDVELAKLGPSIHIQDIQIPKTKFAISDSGHVTKKASEAETVEVL